MEMKTEETQILHELKHSIIDFDDVLAIKTAKKALEVGIDPKIAILNGLSEGMKEVGVKYEKQEYYLPQVMAAAAAMNAALAILKPHLKKESAGNKARKVVICTVEGDVHSIGKGIVATLLGVAGYEVHDMGADVAITSIVATAEDEKADLVGMSTLMTATMIGMEDAINLMKSKGIRDRFKVAVGGAPVNKDFARQIGADATADNAETAVTEINKLFGSV
jgi:corrinoid protein of di/trimethylamine methyltransferase